MNVLFLVLLMGLNNHFIHAMEEELEKVPSFQSGWKSYLMSDPLPFSPVNEVEVQGFLTPSKKNKNRFRKPKEPKNGDIYGFQDFKLIKRAYPLMVLEQKPNDTVGLGWQWESTGNEDFAYSYYLKSVEFEGDARGLFRLARYYERGLAFIKKDLKTARKYYTKAARYGCVDAQFSVAAYFESGNCSFPKDNRLALKWYKKAADKEHPQALASLGNFYEHGIEVAKNHEQAFHYYSLSAAFENAWGQYLLGRAHLYGIGTKHDLGLARHYLLKAAEDNFLTGLLDLANYYDQNKEYGEAFNLYLEAADKDMPESYIKIAIAYEEGKGVVKDPVLAKYFYKKSKHSCLGSGEQVLNAM